MNTYGNMDYTLYRGVSNDLIGKYASPISVDYDEIILNSIRELRKLKVNWDGYGANPINSVIIDNAVAFFETLPLQHRYALDREDITPSSHGTISLEWSNDQGDHIAIEIGKTTMAYFLTKQPELSKDSLPISDNTTDQIIAILGQILE
jgi:hypothetical protein